MLPINHRVTFFKANKDYFNTKIQGAIEMDFYKPRKESVSKWVGEVERRVSKIRFTPRWGTMCDSYPYSGKYL